MQTLLLREFRDRDWPSSQPLGRRGPGNAEFRFVGSVANFPTALGASWLALCLLASPSAAVIGQERPAVEAPRTIQWTDNVATALEKQRRSQRPIVVYVSADFCGYCRKMERETWSDAGVIGQVNQHFIALKLDAQKDPISVERLRVQGFPTTLVFGADGQHASTISGFVRPDELLRALNRPQNTTRAAKIPGE